MNSSLQQLSPVHEIVEDRGSISSSKPTVDKLFGVRFYLLYYMLMLSSKVMPYLLRLAAPLMETSIVHWIDIADGYISGIHQVINSLRSLGDEKVLDIMFISIYLLEMQN